MQQLAQFKRATVQLRSDQQKRPKLRNREVASERTEVLDFKQQRDALLGTLETLRQQADEGARCTNQAQLDFNLHKLLVPARTANAAIMQTRVRHLDSMRLLQEKHCRGLQFCRKSQIEAVHVEQQISDLQQQLLAVERECASFSAEAATLKLT